MKKQIFSIVLALGLLLSAAVPALAAEEPEPTPEPEYRLVKVVETDAGGGQSFYDFTYGQGGYLPTEGTCANNMSFPVTASYDEAWRLTSLQDGQRSCTYDYDEDGNCVRSEETSDYGNGSETTVTEYAYDEDGNCIRRERTSPGNEYSSVTEYTYDEKGNCILESGTSVYEDGTAVSVTKHDYDDAGNCVREEYTSTYADGTESAYSVEYTYDEENRVLSMVLADGEGGSGITYTYSEDGRSVTEAHDNGNTFIEYKVPLLDALWESFSYDLGDGRSISQHHLTLSLEDRMGKVILSIPFLCKSEPTLTYDDNGYLIKADDGAGSYIEFTYEPVA